MNKLKLSSGTTFGHDKEGHRVCIGSQMGRANIMPANLAVPIKLRLERLKWVDGDYDQWGAYWGGCVNGKSVWCAWSANDAGEFTTCVFVRASDRTWAKMEVNNILPKATCFR